MYKFRDTVYARTYKFIFDAIQMLKGKSTEEERIEQETILGVYGSEHEKRIWEEDTDIRGGSDGNS